MADREIVCRTLRQLTPDREWYYLGEAELYLLSCMVNDLRKDIVEENQHLREELREMDAVRAENERLRELVRDMLEEIEVGGFDPMVERHGKSTVYYEEDPSWRVGIRERVRELGIEVE